MRNERQRITRPDQPRLIDCRAIFTVNAHAALRSRSAACLANASQTCFDGMRRYSSRHPGPPIFQQIPDGHDRATLNGSSYARLVIGGSRRAASFAGWEPQKTSFLLMKQCAHCFWRREELTEGTPTNLHPAPPIETATWLHHRRHGDNLPDQQASLSPRRTHRLSRHAGDGPWLAHVDILPTSQKLRVLSYPERE